MLRLGPNKSTPLLLSLSSEHKVVRSKHLLAILVLGSHTVGLAIVASNLVCNLDLLLNHLVCIACMLRWCDSWGRLASLNLSEHSLKFVLNICNDVISDYFVTFARVLCFL